MNLLTAAPVLGAARGLVVAALMTLSTFAAEPTITATASSDQIQVAEPITIDVTVQADKGSKVTFPSGQTKLGEFDVRRTEDLFDVPSSSDANTRTWTRKLTLDTITTGELQVPPIRVQVQPAPVAEVAKTLDAATDHPNSGEFRHDSNRMTQLATSPINIHVASVLEDRGDPTQFRDIQSVVDVPVAEPRSNSVLPWAASGIGLMALALFVGMVVYRRRGWTTPQAWAGEQLGGLDPNDETVSAKLSHIVREFLVMQFEIPETGSTSQEITARLLADNRIDAATAGQLNQLFEIADQVKFAGLNLSSVAVASAINDSRLLIQSIAKHPGQA